MDNTLKYEELFLVYYPYTVIDYHNMSEEILMFKISNVHSMRFKGAVFES